MDELVTLFGGGGFLGRYVAQALIRGGARVRVAERDPRNAYFLKPLGGLGQTQFIAADVTRAESAMRAAAGSSVVINLVGVLQGQFEKAHVDGARNAAQAAAEVGARSFVQISAIGADPAAESRYAQSKGRGEEAARAAFRASTIIRPSIVFGPEDQFVNRFAGMMEKTRILPVIRSAARFQPAWVMDVAEAIAQVALDPRRHGGRTYELGGPEILSMGELNRWIGEATGRRPHLIEIPDAIAQTFVKAAGWLPGAPMTWDQWLMLQKDNVVSPGAEGFDAFGIAPKPLAAVAPGWLVRFRKQGRFSLNPVS